MSRSDAGALFPRCGVQVMSCQEIFSCKWHPHTWDTRPSLEYFIYVYTSS